MKSLLLPMVALVIALVALAVIARLFAKKGGQGQPKTFHKAALLTEREQSMFWRLKEAFPEPDHLVLAQVSFGALLKAGKGTSALHYTQKRADFVLADKACTVLAVIEIDDASHAGRGQQDNARDAMLKAAGYKVVRFNSIPDVETLRRHVIAADAGEAGRVELGEGSKRRLRPPRA